MEKENRVVSFIYSKPTTVLAQGRPSIDNVLNEQMQVLESLVK